MGVDCDVHGWHHSSLIHQRQRREDPRASGGWWRVPGRSVARTNILRTGASSFETQNIQRQTATNCNTSIKTMNYALKHSLLDIAPGSPNDSQLGISFCSNFAIIRLFCNGLFVVRNLFELVNQMTFCRRTMNYSRWTRIDSTFWYCACAGTLQYGSTSLSSKLRQYLAFCSGRHDIRMNESKSWALSSYRAVAPAALFF